jgi:hypothetical protein
MTASAAPAASASISTDRTATAPSPMPPSRSIPSVTGKRRPGWGADAAGAPWDRVRAPGSDGAAASGPRPTDAPSDRADPVEVTARPLAGTSVAPARGLGCRPAADSAAATAVARRLVLEPSLAPRRRRCRAPGVEPCAEDKPADSVEGGDPPTRTVAGLRCAPLPRALPPPESRPAEDFGPRRTTKNEDDCVSAPGRVALDCADAPPTPAGAAVAGTGAVADEPVLGAAESVRAAAVEATAGDAVAGDPVAGDAVAGGIAFAVSWSAVWPAPGSAGTGAGAGAAGAATRLGSIDSGSR